MIDVVTNIAQPERATDRAPTDDTPLLDCEPLGATVPPTEAKAGSVWGAERVGSAFEVARGWLDCEAFIAAGAGEIAIVVVGADALGAPSSAVVLAKGAAISVAVETAVLGEVGALF
jgi:hypothetical protein